MTERSSLRLVILSTLRSGFPGVRVATVALLVSVLGSSLRTRPHNRHCPTAGLEAAPGGTRDPALSAHCTKVEAVLFSSVTDDDDFARRSPPAVPLGALGAGGKDNGKVADSVSDSSGDSNKSLFQPALNRCHLGLRGLLGPSGPACAAPALHLRGTWAAPARHLRLSSPGPTVPIPAGPRPGSRGWPAGARGQVLCRRQAVGPTGRCGDLGAAVPQSSCSTRGAGILPPPTPGCGVAASPPQSSVRRASSSAAGVQVPPHPGAGLPAGAAGRTASLGVSWGPGARGGRSGTLAGDGETGDRSPLHWKGRGGNCHHPVNRLCLQKKRHLLSPPPLPLSSLPSLFSLSPTRLSLSF